MLEEVEKWLAEKKENAEKEEHIKRTKLLIENGLYKEKEITLEEYEKGVDKKNLKYQFKSKEQVLDDGTTKKNYFRKYPLELSDEEYNEVSKYFECKPINNVKGEKIGERIKKFSLAWLVLVLLAGFIAAVCVAVATQSFLMFIEIFGSILFAGCLCTVF